MAIFKRLSAVLCLGLGAALAQGKPDFTLSVGDQVLLTGAAVVKPLPLAVGTGLRQLDLFTDERGRPVERRSWLNRPLKVVNRAAQMYTLSNGSSLVRLAKSKLAVSAMFPLSQDPETRELAGEFVGKTVWGNGGLHAPCEIVDGYHAEVEMRSARVVGVWRLRADGLLLSPRGGLVDDDPTQQKRVSSAALLVMLDNPQAIKVTAGNFEVSLGSQLRQLNAQVPERCAALPLLYANANDLRRNLTRRLPLALPTLPKNFEAIPQTLVGWTRAQVLARFGNPNQPGTLAELLQRSLWDYGSGTYEGGLYDGLIFTFGTDGQVKVVQTSRRP